MRRTLLILALLTVVGLAQSDAPPANIQVNVRRVPLDVIATDDSGAPIRDLRESDLVVLENGREQSVVSFWLEESAAGGKVSAPSALTSNRSTHSANLTVVVLDELNTRFADAAYAHSSLEKFLKSPALNGRRVALLVLGRELFRLHEFTDDGARLSFALARHKPFVPLLPDEYFGSLKGYDTGSPSRPTELPSDVIGKAENDYRQSFERIDVLRRVQITMHALRQIARSLERRPGRKKLLWFSSGFPMSFEKPGQFLQPAGLTEEDPIIRKAVEETSFLLTAARVSIYPIDVRGPAPVDDLAAMSELADQTGGKLYRNGNDLVKSGDNAIRDGDAYYAITYRPLISEADLEFRKIQVKTKRPGVHLRYRKGYFPPRSGTSPAMAVDELKQVANEALLRSDVTFSAKAARMSESSVKIMVMISPEALRLQPLGGDFTRAFEISIAEHLDRQQLYVSSPQKIDLRVEAKRYRNITEWGLPFIVNSSLQAKSNWIRLIVRDLELNRYGSLDLPVVGQ
jgi:VWFA-related protein